MTKHALFTGIIGQDEANLVAHLRGQCAENIHGTILPITPDLASEASMHQERLHQQAVQSFTKRECPTHIFQAPAKVGDIYANSTNPDEHIYKISSCRQTSSKTFTLRFLNASFFSVIPVST